MSLEKAVGEGANDSFAANAKSAFRVKADRKSSREKSGAILFMAEKQ